MVQRLVFSFIYSSERYCVRRVFGRQGHRKQLYDNSEKIQQKKLFLRKENKTKTACAIASCVRVSALVPERKF